MMYTDRHSVLLQFAFSQLRFIVIHGLCCWSESNPNSGSGRLTADRLVNYLLQWTSKITQRSHKFSAQQFKGHLLANYCLAQVRGVHLICWLIRFLGLLIDCVNDVQYLVDPEGSINLVWFVITTYIQLMLFNMQLQAIGQSRLKFEK